MEAHQHAEAAQPGSSNATGGAASAASTDHACDRCGKSGRMQPASGIDLRGVVSHATAPWWYLEKRGFTDAKFGVLCPVCGSEAVKIVVRGDPTDHRGSHYLLYFPEAEGSSIDTTDGRRAPMQSGSGLSVAIPMECESGHGWMLDIGQTLDLGQYRCQVSVSLDAECYEEMFPDLVEEDPAPPDGWEWVGGPEDGHWSPKPTPEVRAAIAAAEAPSNA